MEGVRSNFAFRRFIVVVLPAILVILATQCQHPQARISNDGGSIGDINGDQGFSCKVNNYTKLVNNWAEISISHESGGNLLEGDAGGITCNGCNPSNKQACSLWDTQVVLDGISWSIGNDHETVPSEAQGCFSRLKDGQDQSLANACGSINKISLQNTVADQIRRFCGVPISCTAYCTGANVGSASAGTSHYDPQACGHAQIPDPFRHHCYACVPEPFGCIGCAECISRVNGGLPCVFSVRCTA